MSSVEKLRESFVSVGSLAMPELTRVTDEINGYAVEVDVVIEAGRLVAEAVRVTRLPGGPAVTGEAIRSVPVAMLTKRAAIAVLELTEHEDYTEMSGGRTLYPRVAERLRENGPTTETLEWVAHLYRVALLTGEPPTRRVEAALGVPRSTAGRWIAAARKRDLLGRSEGSGKAGG